MSKALIKGLLESSVANEIAPHIDEDVCQVDGKFADWSAACLLGGEPYDQIIGRLVNCPKSNKTLIL